MFVALCENVTKLQFFLVFLCDMSFSLFSLSEEYTLTYQWGIYHAVTFKDTD